MHSFHDISFRFPKFIATDPQEIDENYDRYSHIVTLFVGRDL